MCVDFPIQWAVDSAIFREVFGDAEVPPAPQEVPYTQITQEQRLDNLRLSFVRGTREITALAFFVGFVGVIYHLVGFVSTEREQMLTQLLDVMGCSPFARLLSWHLSFDAFYLASWIFSAVIVQQLVFTVTNPAIVIIFHILFGLALVSWSTFVAVFFKKAQLSGIGSTIGAVILAILAMVGKDVFGNVAIIVLSIIFPPMAFVFGYIIFCNFERYSTGVDMVSTYGQNNSTMLAIFVCLVVDIVLFAVLALVTEHAMYGTGKFFQRQATHETHRSYPFSLELQSLTKIFRPFSLKRKEPFYAVNDLSLQIRQGEVFCLLGANGSGKSTTLGMIAGSLSITSGDVLVNGQSRRNSRFAPGLLSLCPQKNILWQDLTVRQHVEIWSQIKSADNHKEDIVSLIESCDLSTKITAESATLSGGMKRKLQLAIAFCGDAQVILIDEVSSGIDPLARRKLHDIILDARASRTQILTTHFLDEADLLADRIALLSKGVLRSEGVPVALKNNLGKGYILSAILVGDSAAYQPMFDRLRQPLPETTMKIVSHNEIEYRLPTNDVRLIRSMLNEVELSKQQWGIESYDIAGPRLEDVFLSVMEEAETPEFVPIDDSSKRSSVTQFGSSKEMMDGQITLVPMQAPLALDTHPLRTSEASSVDFAQIALTTGRETAVWEQVLSQLWKRWTIARRNPWPSVASIVVGVVAIGVSLVFLTGTPKYSATCRVRPNGQPLFTLPFPYFELFVGQPIALGPSLDTYSRVLGSRTDLFTPVIVNSTASLLDYVHENYATSLQGGAYLDNSTQKASFAWFVEAGTFGGLSTLSALSNVMFDNKLAQQGFLGAQSRGYRITTTYRGFDSPHYGQLGSSLKFLIFFGVAMCVMFAFAALYPTSERLRDVKALHYSNGLTPFSLHLGHLLYEIPTTALIAVIITVIYAAVVPGVVHSIGVFFVVLWLYGIAATLLSFIVALFARSQLAAFAFAAGIQAVLFLVYIVAYLVTLTYAPALKTTAWIRYEHYAITLIPIPIGSIARAIIVGINIFSTACIGPGGTIATSFGSILLYGGPILYLIVHILFLFGCLVWWDSGHKVPKFMQRNRAIGSFAAASETKIDIGVLAEAERVSADGATDVLLIQGVSKSYGTLQAVKDVSFGVARDEVFALLGPNSAGKSTTYGIIRGEVRPDMGDVLISQKSITTERNAARASLGVCPQFDAMDALSVRQHLSFYAQVKGIPRKSINENVDKLISAVSLAPFADRLARKLSGGNQRKLSLAIAMIGNPDVLLIDEASSGMDIGAKRRIWQTLTKFMPGRAVVITTHSMEEADALASRVGIIAKKMLAVGDLSDIRRRYGDAYELAIICRHDDDLESVQASCTQIIDFIHKSFPGAMMEGGRVYHGHLKFKIPCSGSVAHVFDVMEDNKTQLNIEHYGIQRASLESAFLKLIRQHNIMEEGYEAASESSRDQVSP